MRFVDLKSQEQLDIQTLHRVRSRLVAERTTLINQLRAVLLERGVIFAAGRMKFQCALDGLLSEADEIMSPRIRSLVIELRDEWRMLDKKIEALNAEFVALARQNIAMRRLTSIPGIGVLNATALVAAIGDAGSFKHARDLGAWLGLVPRQFTTGGKARLLGITKRGNTYLRTLLVHGARAAMHTLSQSDTPIGQWLQTMLSRGVEPHRVCRRLQLLRKWSHHEQEQRTSFHLKSATVPSVWCWTTRQTTRRGGRPFHLSRPRSAARQLRCMNG